MKKKILLFMIIIGALLYMSNPFSYASAAGGATHIVNEDISENTNWESGDTYIICRTSAGENPKVCSGVTLIIGNGATIKLGSGSINFGGTDYSLSDTFEVYGSIEASGTTFTSYSDTGYWSMLSMRDGSSADFADCTIERGGTGASTYAMIQTKDITAANGGDDGDTANDVNLSFSGCLFRDSGYYGNEQRSAVFYQNCGSGGDLNFQNCVFRDMGKSFNVYRSDGDFDVVVNGCTFENLAASGGNGTILSLAGGEDVSIKNCIFRYNGGDPATAKSYAADIVAYDASTGDAPRNLSVTGCAFDGNYAADSAGQSRYPISITEAVSLNAGIENPGNTVENYGSYAKVRVVGDEATSRDIVWGNMGLPYLVVVGGTSTSYIYPTFASSLTIEPGLEVRFAAASHIVMKGSIKAEGTASAPILFRSDADFSAQNSETGKDGYILISHLNSQNIESSFEYCNFQHMYEGIKCSNTTYVGTASISIKNCSFDLMDYAAVEISSDRDIFSRDNALIENCVISDSMNYGLYMKAYTDYTTACTIKGCLIENCGKSGIFLVRSSALIKNTVLDGNGCFYNASDSADENGSGIVNQLDAGVELLNCTIYGSGRYGIYTYGSTTGTAGKINVKNSIIWDNKDTLGTVYGIRAKSSSSLTYSDINGTDSGGVSRGTGCISAEPLFADASDGDFHLKSAYGRYKDGSWLNDTESSPCIDAGNPASDYSTEPLPNGKRINMGAYGNTAQASKSASSGDESLEGAVSVSGSLKYGETLTADTSAITSPNPGSLTYQWQRGGADIAGADQSAYIAGEDDIGTIISVTVTAENYSGSLSAAAEGIIAKADGPAAPSAPGMTDRSASSITLIQTEGYEYSKDGTNWQTSNLFSGLTANTSYTFYQRVAETATAKASSASQGASFSTNSSSGSGSGGSGGASGGSGTATEKSEKISIKSGDGNLSVSGSLMLSDNGFRVAILKDQFSLIAAGKNSGLIIDTEKADIFFDSDVVNYVSGLSADGDISLEIKEADKSLFSHENQERIGDHPVYDFTFMAGDNQISDLGGGNVTISMPYTLREGEDPNAIVVYYIDDAGQLTIVNGAYNKETGRVSFVVSHFSLYAIAYNKVNFSDVAEETWYYDAVSFIAARGITTGDRDGKFKPSSPLTRGQFIVMLMRAYGIASEEVPNDNFSDAGNTYYTNYLAAAKRLGITKGRGGNMFAPDAKISRQDMFTLLYRALLTIDKLPEEAGNEASANYKDWADISDYAKDAVSALIKSQIISGDNNCLYPKEISSRSQMAQVLYKLLSQ